MADAISATLERQGHISNGSPGSGVVATEGERVGVIRKSDTEVELLKAAAR